MTNEWIKIKPYGEDSYTYWVSGIYKIVSYEPKKFHAFFIQNGVSNWGDYVCTPPEIDSNGRYWNSLESAKKSCKEHAASGYEPTPSTVKRAAVVLAGFLEQEKIYAKEMA